MDTQQLAIFYSLIPLVCWGIANAMQKNLVRNIGSLNLIIFRGVIVTTILLIVLFFNLNKVHFDFNQVVFGIFISAVSSFGIYFLNRGLEKGEAGTVIPISSTRVLITLLTSILLLNEVLNNIQLISILIIFIGIILTSINIRKLKESDFFNFNSGIPYGMLAALFWGITFAFFGIPTAALGAYLFVFILELSVLIVSLSQLFITGEKLRLDLVLKKQNLRTLIAISLMGALASLFMNLGYETGEISIVTAVSSASPLISVLYGKLFLHEKLTLQQYIAGFLIVLGVVFISYFN